ncbi:MAG TPA: hypothetical protein VKR06_03945 [Ktedonosporobacter sp.]|nr:hypothetical protein [Ktedonosporobacter sp.]
MRDRPGFFTGRRLWKYDEVVLHIPFLVDQSPLRDIANISRKTSWEIAALTSTLI